MKKNFLILFKPFVLGFILVCFSFFFISCSSVPLVKKNENLPFFQSMKINEYEFKNGLRVYLVPDSSSPTAAIQIWYGVGSKDEVKKYTGLAHLFEHMMFKKTKNLPEGSFDRILEEIGVDGTNAFTTNDNTVYVHEFPKTALEKVLELEAERMQNLVVDEASFTTERDVVKNERKMRTDNSPTGILLEALFGTVYKEHPYHWPIIGYEEDLNRMNAKDAYAFYKKYYAPNNAVIVIAGDINPSQTIDLIHKYFHNIPSSPIKRNSFTFDGPQKSAVRKNIKINMETETIYMAYRMPTLNHVDYPVFEVLHSLLSDGRSSRLTKKLVDAGISSSITSGDFNLEHPGMFIFTSQLQKGKLASEAEKVILAELENLLKNPPTDVELERAKNTLQFSFYSDFVSNKSKAYFVGSNVSKVGSYQAGLDRLNQVMKVTAADLQRIVKEYLQPQQRTVIVGEPKRD